MRPPGLNAAFQSTHYTSLQDNIYDVVESALSEGMSAVDFKRNVEECWEIAAKERLQRDLTDLSHT